MCTGFPFVLRHWSLRTSSCGDAAFPRSIHWNAKELEPFAPGTKRAGPGRLVRCCSPMFTLRTRNATGAPESPALAWMITGPTCAMSVCNPGTRLQCVDDVDTGEVRHCDAMHLTGVEPLFVP